MDEIAQVLDGQAEYSLEPGKTPVGEDVAEYFYFKNKKGYCEHFATVATLMLRMKEFRQDMLPDMQCCQVHLS